MGVMPHLKVPSSKDYQQEYQRLQADIPAELANNPVYCDDILPYNVQWTSAEKSLLHKIAMAVNAGVSALMNSEYYALLGFDSAVCDALGAWDDITLADQWLRPDILVTKQGLHVCEINARFVFNGTWLSSMIQRDCPLRPLLLSLPQSLICKEREQGWDVHFFAKHTGSIFCTPSQYQREPRKDLALLLELHSDELIPLLDTLRKDAVNGRKFINDPRTSIAGHSKALLALLADEALMEPLIGSAHARILCQSIIPTQTQSQRGKPRPGAWVAKKAIGGKGQGMVFSDKCDEKSWKDIWFDPSMIIQPALEEATWQTPCHGRVHLAGTLMIIGQAVQPGVVRVYRDRRYQGLALSC